VAILAGHKLGFGDVLTGKRPVAMVGMPLSLKSENQSSEAVIRPVVGMIFVGTKSRWPKPR
jgi:hypothetical protein